LFLVAAAKKDQVCSQAQREGAFFLRDYRLFLELLLS
jgi:hypothetical protein